MSFRHCLQLPCLRWSWRRTRHCWTKMNVEPFWILSCHPGLWAVSAHRNEDRFRRLTWYGDEPPTNPDVGFLYIRKIQRKKRTIKLAIDFSKGKRQIKWCIQFDNSASRRFSSTLICNKHEFNCVVWLQRCIVLNLGQMEKELLAWK